MDNLSSSFALLVFFSLHIGGIIGYTSIFSFGDSYSDTGSRLYYDRHCRYGRYPFGMTYFHRPTGRCSDGRLVIDFIAQALGLPFTPPYLGHENDNFAHGVNFAVAAAPALDMDFFDKMGVIVDSNYTLRVQLEQFRRVLPFFCASPSMTGCKEKLGNALFLMGEIGVNDYYDMLYQGKSVEEVRTIVPEVIDTVTSIITALIDEGAVTFLVPGMLPSGCLPPHLTNFPSEKKEDYDPSLGCLKWFNEFSQFHNDLLQIELARLRDLHPHASIIYADYYNTVMEMYQNSKQLGFNGDLKACCGGGGPFNFNSSAECGSVGFSVCDDPSVYVSWDGDHLTEAAYKWIAKKWLATISHISSSCISSNPQDVDHPSS